MQQKQERELLVKYLKDRCSEIELKQVALYFANVEYPDTFDGLLEEGWRKFKAQCNTDDELATRLLQKFNERLKAKG